MTPEEVGQYFKQNYPGQYDQYPDAVIGQRALIKYPEFATKPSMQQGNQDSLMATIGKAAKDSFVRPAAAIKDLGTNPETMANAMPPVLGTAGGVLPIPGGATLGTVAGQGIRDLALTALKKPVPSPLQHGIELGGAALGDLTAFPAINRSRIGGEIGGVEKAAGVPPVQDIPSLPKPKAGDPVSGGIDEAIRSVSDAQKSGGAVPTYWKQLKDQIDSFYGLGKDVKLTDLDKGKLKWLNAQVQKGLNEAVPGRGPLAANLARSQIVPNTIGDVYKATPTWAKATGSLLGGDALLRILSGIGRKQQ